MKVKQKKSALLPGLITVLMVVAAVAGGLRMTDPDGGRLDTMRQELETITAENEGLTAQVEALRTETAEQKALPEAIQKQKDEGFRLLGELERQIRAGESDKRIAYLTFEDGPYDNTIRRDTGYPEGEGGARHLLPAAPAGTMWRRSSGRYGRATPWPTTAIPTK